MFDLQDSLLVAVLLQPFVFTIASHQRASSVGGGVRVEDLDIAERSLMPPSPEATHRNVQSGTVLGVGGCSVEVFSCDGLQPWFCADFMTNFRQQCCSYIPDLIVSQSRKTSFGTGQGMLNRERGTTCAVLG